MKIARSVVLFGVFSALVSASASAAITSSLNTGSLGLAGDATNDDGVTFGPGALADPADLAPFYPGGPLGPGNPNGPNSFVNYNPALNPAANLPFTVEFWANPGSEVAIGGTGRAPVFNRVSSGNRSGWVFFQRDGATGWNFAMYNGAGSGIGWDLTGGTSFANAWSHVVATWDGAQARLYVNGFLADDSNTAGLNGVYIASTAATFSIGGYDTGENSFFGGVDETALYASALSADRVMAHFLAATVPSPGAYAAEVFADKPVEYLQNAPEPTSAALIALGLFGAGVFKRRRAVPVR